jgi:hypothetical protein
MESFTKKNLEASRCHCDGLFNPYEPLISEHQRSVEHINWAFDRLVDDFLSLKSFKERVQSLKEQRTLCLTGKVIGA